MSEEPVAGTSPETPVTPEPSAAPGAPYTGPERRNLARRRVITTAAMTIIALIAFITGVVVFNGILMPRLIHGGGQVVVPDLSNLTVVQAEQQLAPLGLQLSRAGERFDPSVPRGGVVAQDPAAGSRVRGSRRVSVVVSLGEEFSSVPSLSGETQRSAEALLKSAGLRVGFVSRAPSDVVGEGLVAGSDPGPESVLPRDTAVHLLVSMGPSEQSYVMPDLSGREIGGVRGQLEALGFKVVTPAGGGAMGTIVSQDPPPGSRITQTTVIVLQATGRVIP
jgi:serine/threonine-protein kinase